MARELQAREKEKKEQELRDLAMRARMERGGGGAYAPPPAAARSEQVLAPEAMVLLLARWKLPNCKGWQLCSYVWRTHM